MSYLDDLARAPYRHDFYQALRRIECLHPGKPRLGQSLRPVDDPVRLGQEASLSFAPARFLSRSGAINSNLDYDTKPH